MKKIFENEIFPQERALYNLDDIEIINCRFEGEEDGESAVKECSNVVVKNCYFDLRYPLWCVTNCTMDDSILTSSCRSPIWYSKNMLINNCKLDCVKVFRMCDNIKLTNSNINSIEFAWNAKNFYMENCNITSDYPFLMAENVTIKNCKFNTKYPFQQAKHVYLENVTIEAKDAFWDSEDIVCKNCTLIGDFLAWYSKGLTLIDCTIISSQPLCYADDLKVINCIMEECDLAFEYSTLEANVKGTLKSIKNPKAGLITVDKECEVIKGNSAYESNAQIIFLDKK